MTYLCSSRKFSQISSILGTTVPPGYSFYFALDFRADNVAAFFDNFLIGKWPVVVSCMLDWRKKFVDASNT